MIEVRLHGRGGQGAVTAVELLAVSAAEGGKWTQSFPFFGVERTGAPVQAFCRIDEKPVRVHQNVYEPDIVMVLDASLLSVTDVTSGLKKNGIVIVNTKKSKKELGISGEQVFIVDANGIALKHLGKPIVNTAMLGAFAKVTGLVPLDALKRAIRHRFKGEIAEKNVAAIEECYNSTA
ncbi:Pyruvate/ketoisovalerate oxidoreductases common subunit gamma [uncultured archaeon]|nr:Pyruvate/ketoisovalerate oxidoreductases common subunit gamma [uncultured archaeon]